MPPHTEGFTRSVVRVVLIVVTVILALYLIYLLRKTLGWMVIAGFIAIAASGPVNIFQRHMRRGFAIALVYALLVIVPLGIGALIIPPMVSQAEHLANNVPSYVDDVQEFVNENETFRDLDEKYDVLATVRTEAEKLPTKIGDAAGTLQDIGVTLVSSIFAGVSIFILSIFMVAGGPRWRDSFLASQPVDRAERLGRAFEHIGNAIGNYVRGVMIQSTIAGVASFTVLTILGAPFAAPLALIVALFDLIPVIGATIAATLVTIVMLFVNFPVGVIVWILFAIVYQQIADYVLRPWIQGRAVQVEPFVIIVAALFGATLFGVIGALLAIPAAASIQIAVRELLAYRRESAMLPDANRPAAAESA